MPFSSSSPYVFYIVIMFTPSIPGDIQLVLKSYLWIEVFSTIILESTLELTNNVFFWAGLGGTRRKCMITTASLQFMWFYHVFPNTQADTAPEINQISTFAVIVGLHVSCITSCLDMSLRCIRTGVGYWWDTAHSTCANWFISYQRLHISVLQC